MSRPAHPRTHRRRSARPGCGKRPERGRLPHVCVFKGGLEPPYVGYLPCLGKSCDDCSAESPFLHEPSSCAMVPRENHHGGGLAEQSQHTTDHDRRGVLIAFVEFRPPLIRSHPDMDPVARADPTLVVFEGLRPGSPIGPGVLDVRGPVLPDPGRDYPPREARPTGSHPRASKRRRVVTPVTGADVFRSCSGRRWARGGRLSRPGRRRHRRRSPAWRARRRRSPRPVPPRASPGRWHIR